MGNQVDDDLLAGNDADCDGWIEDEEEDDKSSPLAW